MIDGRHFYILVHSVIVSYKIITCCCLMIIHDQFNTVRTQFSNLPYSIIHVTFPPAHSNMEFHELNLLSFYKALKY